MAKKRFKVKTTMEYEHIVEIDDEIWDEEELKDWATVFYNFKDLESHAKYLAEHSIVDGRSFVEGYGHILREGEPTLYAKIKKVESNESINLITVEEDVYQEVEELEEED